MMTKIQRLILCSFMLSICNYGTGSDNVRSMMYQAASEVSNEISNEILETYIVASNLAIESHIERCKTLVKASHVLPALIYATGKNNVDAYEYVRDKNNN